MNKIICINKPQEFTSFDVVAKLRGILRIKKIGHGGTLDPMATGVLPIMIGKATRVCDMFPDTHKEYRVKFKLGLETATYDIWGEVTNTSDKTATYEQVKEAFETFSGMISQIPPMYSAVQIGGKRLYDLAREGITVDRPAREVEIFNCEITDFNEETGEYEAYISCSAGTYIRTIIFDLGRKLETLAVMTGLVRCVSGMFTLDDCMTFEELQSLKDTDSLQSIGIGIDRVFMSYDKISLDSRDSERFVNGAKVFGDNTEGTVRVYSSSDEFLGVGEYTQESRLKVKKLFCER